MKRIWILLVISLVGVGLFTACSSNADTMVQPSPSPSVSPSASPMATDSPAPSAAPTATDREANGTSAGVNTVEDAQRVSDQVSEEVEKLSELKSAEAVVMGTIAVVGVEYDAQYQEGLTDRLKEMIEARVQAVDKSIVTVHVKDSEADYQKLMELREKLSNQELTFEQLQTQVLNLAGNDQDTTVG